MRMSEDRGNPQMTRPTVGIDAESIRAETLRIEIESLQAQLLDLSARQAEARAELERLSETADSQPATHDAAPGPPVP